MDDLDALLAEIIAHPEEDTPRLAYADCLEEQGADWYAQFIRDQIAGVPRAVLRSAVVPLEPLVGLVVGMDRDAGLGTVVTGRGSVVFRRGFADEVTCAAADWLRHGLDVRRLHPIVRVNLTTWYPEYRVEMTTVRVNLTTWYPEYRVEMTTGTPFVLTPHGDPLTDGSLLDGPRFGGRTYREASCDALAACYPGVAFTLPEPFRPVAAALEQITGRRA